MWGRWQQARSLASSNFKEVYTSAECPSVQPKLTGPVYELIVGYCKARGISETAGKGFYRELEQEAFEHKDELLGQIPAAAQRLWTSGKKLTDEVEFCSIVNYALHSDDGAMMQHVAPILRAINKLLVLRGVRNSGVVPYPALTFRGGALPPEHLAFYESMQAQGATYRVPGLLATSFDRSVANRFMMIAEDRQESVVLWIIHLHPDGKDDETKRCRHVNFIERTHYGHEKEFLFAAYAPFKVRQVGAPPLPHVCRCHCPARSWWCCTDTQEEEGERQG